MKKNISMLLFATIMMLSLSYVNPVFAGQDYNSSRSNKPTPILENDDIEEDDLDVHDGGFGDPIIGRDPGVELQLTVDKKIAIFADSEMLLDVAPFIERNRVMLPFRFIGERVGAEISWDATQKKVGYILGDTKIELWIGKNMALVNGIPVPIDLDSSIAPMIKDSTTVVPLRFVSETLGFLVDWNSATKEVTIQ